MKVGDLCTRTVRTVSPGDHAREAARRMREHGVGTLVVIDGSAPLEGIVTDRDLVIRVLATHADPESVPVADVMTRGPAAIRADAPVERALEIMADQKVRRIVVLDDEGGLVGLLALDDIVSHLVEEVDEVGRLIRRQVPV